MNDDIQGMTELQKRFAAIADHREMLGKMAILAVSYAKQNVHRKTGNLGRTIRVGTITDDSAQILAGGVGGVGYAQAEEFGTRPHTIVPKRRKALAWGGARRLSGSLRSGARATSFATKVEHPGTQPHPFLKPAAEKAVEDSGVELIVRAWNEAA